MIEPEDESVLLAAALAAVALLYESERVAASNAARRSAWRSAARGGESWGTADRDACAAT